MYREVLKLYCRDAEARMEFLNAAQAEQDIKNFITQVHALKSASASIGGAELSHMAAALESAGGKGDMEYIRENVPSFLKNLTATAEQIKTAVSGHEAVPLEGESRGVGGSLKLLENALASENVGDVDKILAELCEERLDEAAKDSLSMISDLVLVGEFKKASAIVKNQIDNNTRRQKGENNKEGISWGLRL